MRFVDLGYIFWLQPKKILLYFLNLGSDYFVSSYSVSWFQIIFHPTALTLKKWDGWECVGCLIVSEVIWFVRFKPM